MSEATILFENQEQIRTLFGARDRHLRQVRDTVGLEIVLRGDELRLHGNDDQIERGLEVFSELRAIVEQRGTLLDTEVDRVLGIEVVETATQVGDVRASDVRASDVSNGANDDNAAIDLFEKAKKIHPRTSGQAGYVKAIRENDLVFCAGPAGTGKTYLAVAMAVNWLRQEMVRKIVLVRPAVEAGEKLGFLPGDMLAKVNPYLRPLLDALGDILGFEQVKRYIENDVIEIAPLAYMRGRTLNDTFIILDEGQNTTITQMQMFLTRMGTDSKIVVTGDTTQIDLEGDVPCGLTDAMRRLHSIDGVGAVELTRRDIVRHRLVSEIVRAYDRQRKPREPRKK